MSDPEQEEGGSEPKAKAEPEPKAKAKAKAEPEAKAKAEPEAKPEAKAASEAEGVEAAEPRGAPPPPRPILLQLEDVVAGFGAMEVLHGISLTVREGDIVALIGANGAGKTTTLNVISNVVKTRSGRVSFAGEQTSGGSIVETVRRGVVHVPEGRRLFSELTVQENLEMGAFLRDDSEGIAADIERMFDLFPILRERSGQRGGSLSGGEQQMLAIARGLMAKPRLLLLDEPSLGLAPIICQQIFRTIKELNEEGVTVFLVEQNAHAALELAHRAYVMETGTISMEGEAAALRDDPRVKAAYLGE